VPSAARGNRGSGSRSPAPHVGRSATSGSPGAAAAAPLCRRHQALLLTTGGATLALELLASRVLTPYFGVSLYIWAGILSITLIFLAVGYRVGGLLADLGEAELLEVRGTCSVSFTHPPSSCFGRTSRARCHPTSS